MQKPQKLILSLTLALGLATMGMSNPANAKTVTGPKGSTATGSGVVVPNRQGGYTGAAEGKVNGVNGTSANGKGKVTTDGNWTLDKFEAKNG